MTLGPTVVDHHVEGRGGIVAAPSPWFEAAPVAGMIAVGVVFLLLGILGPGLGLL